MTQAPEHLKDARQLLSEQGFATSNVWYHGTSSALVDSIMQHGLQRSGDQALNRAAEQTMATIGNAFEATVEPVYLTQSSELAHFWAEQTVRTRSVRVGGHNEAAVVKVALPDALNARVKPDVGAATLLMLEAGERYMAYLARLYQASGLPAPNIDLRRADRMAYLHLLGMAYLDADVAPDFLALVDN